jgi:predicted permease
LEILSVTLPIFMFVALGYGAKKIKLAGLETRNFLSKTVYYLALPALILRGILSSDFESTFRLRLVAHNLMVTGSIFIVTFAAAFLIKDVYKRGAFNMSCFRSNQGYMGLPIVNGFYGGEAVSKAAVVNSIDSPAVIIISVLALEVFKKKVSVNGNDSERTVSKLARKLLGILTNPFLLSAVFGLGASYFKVPVLSIKVIDEFLRIAGDMAMPLALLSIGCSIDVRHLKENLRLVLAASVIKLVLMPVVAFVLGYFIFKFRGIELGLTVMLPAMPTSVSSHIMAIEMDTDDKLMATAIGFSTFASVVTVSVLQYFLKGFM